MPHSMRGIKLITFKKKRKLITNRNGELKPLDTELPYKKYRYVKSSPYHYGLFADFYCKRKRKKRYGKGIRLLKRTTLPSRYYRKFRGGRSE